MRFVLAIIQFAASGAVGIAVAWASQLPLALAVLLGVTVAIMLGLGLGLWDEWRTREREPTRTERLGIRNTGGGRSISHRPTFGTGLDTAIENRDGGQSEDYDSTFE